MRNGQSVHTCCEFDGAVANLSTWELTMSVDMLTASRMAKASDVTYFVDAPGGAPSCPFYPMVGFAAPPQWFVANVINAALVGTTATESQGHLKTLAPWPDRF